MISTFALLIVVLSCSFLAPVSGGNINIDSTCPISPGCLQCLSRRSGELERCQQLYFYITYSTGASLTRTNQNEIDRYCNGDCPLILATANYFCTDGASSIEDLLQLCPSYSVIPTGSFNVPRLVNASSCLTSSSSQCLQCIAEDNTEAVRCMQLYFLANHQNFSSTYASRYCEGNCPLILNSFGSYCGSFFTNSYSYCQQRGNGQYCGQLQAQSPSDFNTAISNCFAGCETSNCVDSISEYGCCLRQSLGDRCSNVLTCNFQVDASTTAIQVDSDCSVTSCETCLTRDNDDLQHCQQLYAYLVAAQDLMASQASSIMEDFCSGNCPILLLTVDYYCIGLFSARPFLLQFCPSYQRIPSASVDVQASYGDDQFCPVRQVCEECIGSRSPEVTRCLQIYLLALQHPNQTDFYVTEFCQGNCPLTLSTSLWYCSSAGSSLVEGFFSACRRTAENQFCSTLIQQSQSDFNSAQSDCQISCTSSACIDAQNRYGCCLSGPNIPCNFSECAVLTAHAPPPNLAPSILLAFFSVLMYHISGI